MWKMTHARTGSNRVGEGERRRRRETLDFGFRISDFEFLIWDFRFEF
jgi:hypothetical protein